MRTILKLKLNDWLVWILGIYLLAADLFIFMTFSLQIALFCLPFLLLTILAIPYLHASLFHQVIIYDKGMSIKGKFFEWKKIRSISLKNGRYKDDVFWKGNKLPSVQKIYLLDIEGREYCAIVDIDHALKNNRSKNNLHLIENAFHDLGRANYLSDWAQNNF